MAMQADIKQARAELASYSFDYKYYAELAAAGEKERAAAVLTRMTMIERTIDELPQPYRCILYLKYIRNRSFTEISRKLNFCERQIYRQHGRALILYAIQRKPD